MAKQKLSKMFSEMFSRFARALWQNLKSYKNRFCDVIPLPLYSLVNKCLRKDLKPEIQDQRKKTLK